MLTPHTRLTNEEERNGPPQSAPESHLFRTGRAAPRAQHDHRIHLRGRPPLPLHDAHRLRQRDPGAVIRPDPGEWHPRMPERLDEEELADRRAGRHAVYQLAARTVGGRLRGAAAWGGNKGAALRGSRPATERRFAKRKPRRGRPRLSRGRARGKNSIVLEISNSITQ